MERRPGRLEVFEALRPRLFGIAYRMLGSVDDANEVLQEAYLRWHRTDEPAIRVPDAWLVAVVTRLSIDRLRQAAPERQAYAGPWLPEPIATDERSMPDRRAELASDLSMAFLVLLERLAPEERAALLLREVFDATYGEIASVLERSEVACRQIVHRARSRVREDRARFEVAPQAKERVIERFLAALAAGDKSSLLALVAEDATWTADGGGKVSAMRNVVHGPDRIVRLLLGLERKGQGVVRHTVAWINGEPAIATHAGEQLLFITSIETDGDRLLAFYRVLNPDKLRHVAGANASRRGGERHAENA